MYSASPSSRRSRRSPGWPAAYRLDHLGVGDAVGGQLVGIEHDLVLAHHAADGGDFGHVGHGLEFVLEEPVLQGTQLARSCLPVRSTSAYW
jgi:hypothetical protein